MFVSLSLVPPMWIYVSYSMWLTGIVTIAAIATVLIYPKHYKKIALTLGITGLLQIIMAGFLYYPSITFIVFPSQSAIGLIAITCGAIITIYGTVKKKNRKEHIKTSSEACSSLDA